MGNLRRAFDLFEQKTQILRLLDISSQAEGVRIYIGGESQVVPFEELSVVSAPMGSMAKLSERWGDRPDAHAVRQDDPDRGHHFQAGFQRAQLPQINALQSVVLRSRLVWGVSRFLRTGYLIPTL